MTGQTINQARKSLSVAGFDPSQAPLLSLPPLPALPLQALQTQFLQQAFSQPVAWHVDAIFKDDFYPEFLPGSSNVRSAVCIAFTPPTDTPGVLFTRRAIHLHNHAGQISFPGGRIERSDASAIAAALRETQEEVGIAPEYMQYLGQHPIFVTSTRFAMRPVLVQLQAGFQLQADTSEVAEIFEVPLQVLMDPQQHQLHQLVLPDGSSRLYFAISWGPYFIWGATAVLIRNVYHYLAAAWRHLAAPDFQTQGNDMLALNNVFSARAR